jgi:transposase
LHGSTVTRDDLELENERLRKENDALRSQNDELTKQVRDLTKQVAELTKQIEEWKRGFRGRHRRFSSRREDAPRPDPKRPGRKAGHAASHRSKPDKVDHTIEYPVPETCACGGSIEPTATTAEVIVEDLPPVEVVRTRHVAHEGRCQRCGRIRRAKMPGAPDAGAPIAGVVLGERAQSLAISLRFDHHLPLRHMVDVFDSFFGMRISHGALSHAMIRTANRSSPAVDEIRDHMRDASVLGGDETSWRQNGDIHWVWLLRTPHASLFHLARHRDAETFDAFFPRGFVGVLVTDCYAVYTRRQDILHAYCGAHVLCEAKKILELEPCAPASAFVEDLRWFFRRSECVRQEGDFDAIESMRNKFHFLATNSRYHGNDDIERLQTRLLKHEASFTIFLSCPDIPWNNNGSERDLRPGCLHRKVVRQTRSNRGALAFGHWMSITQTLRKNGLPLGPWFALASKNHRAGLSLPSVFATPPS